MRNKRSFAVQVVTDAMEALRRVVYGRGCLEACADNLAITHQTLSKQLNEEEGTSFSVKKLQSLEQFLDADAIAECFAARRGGVFIKLPPIDTTLLPEEMTRGWALLIAEFAASSKAFSDMVADGRIAKAELDRFHAELRDFYAAGERLVETLRARMLAEARA